ncbi:MAG: hypothetical protein ACQKBT_07165 [Puniceicoccales bacterium]
MSTPRKPKRLEGKKAPPLLSRSDSGSARQQFALGLAAVLGWFLALGALQGWIDFRDLLKNDQQWFRDDMIFLNRQVKLTDSVGLTSSQITPKLLAEIRAAEGVTLAEPILRNHFPASVKIGGGAIPSIVSEIFLEAIPEELFSPDLKDWQWKPGDPIVPVLVPRQFLNLYNFGFAPGKGLPPVSENTAKRVRFSLIAHPHYGDPAPFTASIAGFSDQIESILVPVSFLAWANQEFGTPQSPGYNRIALALKNPDSAAFHRLLERHNLLSSHGTLQNARLQILLDLALLILGSAGGIILILILLLFLTEAEALIASQRDRIQKLFFLGYSPNALLVRMAGLRLLNTLVPALLGFAFIWLTRRPITAFLNEAGLTLPTHLASLTILAWAMLLVLANAWLIWRIRGRILKIYK